MKVKKRLITWIIILILLILAGFYFDNILVKYISFLRTGILDSFFLTITFLSSEILIFFILTALFLWRENKRRWILPLWLSLGLSALISFALKIIIQRQRPFQLGLVSLLPSLQEASYSIWNFSFPSFQSMLVFCAIPILSEQFPRFKKFWIAFAVLVAFSRLYFGVHFISDVIAGGLIGYLTGIMIVKAEKENKFGQRIYNKIFKR